MQEIEEIISNIEIEPLEINSQHWVDVTYIIDPHKFYTRLTKNKNIVQKIETLQCTSKPSSVKLHDTVLFNLKEDADEPKYARGKITGLLEKAGETLAFNVFALDYGYQIDNVSFDRIWACDDRLQSIPPLAIYCRLAFCEKIESTWKEATETFKYFVGEKPAKMVIENNLNNDYVTVSLYNSCPNDISKMLVLIDLTRLG